MEVLGMLVSSKRLMKLLNTKKEKEELTMCKAIDDIYEDGVREGREEERRNTLREAARAETEKNRAETEKNRADTAESENMRLKNLLDMAGIAY